MARIRRSHRRGRGSIPRTGACAFASPKQCPGDGFGCQLKLCRKSPFQCHSIKQRILLKLKSSIQRSSFFTLDDGNCFQCGGCHNHSLCPSGKELCCTPVSTKLRCPALCTLSIVMLISRSRSCKFLSSSTKRKILAKSETIL